MIGNGTSQESDMLSPPLGTPINILPPLPSPMISPEMTLIILPPVTSSPVSTHLSRVFHRREVWKDRYCVTENVIEIRNVTNQLTRDPPRMPSDAKQAKDLFESFTPYFPIAGPSFPRRDLLESTPDDEDEY